MKISIVIPNYNGRHLLESNLPAVIQAIKNKKNNISELIIVDDGSVDDSISYLSKNFKGLYKLIRHTKNRGFSAAVNAGVRATHADLVLLLNNDVFPDSDFLVEPQKLFINETLVDVSLLEKKWLDKVREIFNEATLTVPENTFMQSGGKEGKHTEQLGFILTELQYMQRTYPGAEW